MMSDQTKENRNPAALNIAMRLKTLRKACGFSLDVLAAKTGVSRAAISLIERGQSSPTAVVLERLATGLGVTLAHLFESNAPQLSGPVLVHANSTAWWQDPGSGYQRRNVSPSGANLQIVESIFPAGASITYESTLRDAVLHEQIWILEGEMHITLGDETHNLQAGDCLYFQLNQTVGFHNPGTVPARYAVVISK